MFINIFVQKVLNGTSWLYIAMYLRRCVRTRVLKNECTSILLYIKSCRYSIISIVILGKKLTWQKFIIFTFKFLKVKPKVSTYKGAALILLYNIIHQLTITISNNKLNRIDTNINSSRDLCVWCGFCATVTHSLAKLLSDCDVEKRC